MPGDIIVVERDLLKSIVFRSLNGTAKTVLFDFFMKCRMKRRKGKGGRKTERDILNNGELEYCYGEAEKKGIPRSSFMRTLDELITKGFIDVPHSGSGGQKGDKSLYSISERWRAYGTDKFIHAFRPKDIRAGRGFKKGNLEWKKAQRPKCSNIGVKNGNPTIAENGNPSQQERHFNCQKWQSKERAKTAETLISTGAKPILAL